MFKGSYAETMTGAVAAYRAGNPPDIVQVFEVGTATMMAAKGAIKPVYQLMKDADEPFNPDSYLPAVTGCHSTPDGTRPPTPSRSTRPSAIGRMATRRGRRGVHSGRPGGASGQQRLRARKTGAFAQLPQWERTANWSERRPDGTARSSIYPGSSHGGDEPHRSECPWIGRLGRGRSLSHGSTITPGH